jgi:hypothetical protein
MKQGGCSAEVLASLKKVCGKENVKTYYTNQQSDGWSCGYICTWWKLLMVHHGKNFDDRRPIDAVPDQPPVGWDQLVWLMLELRDLGIADSRSSALNAGLYPYYIEAMNEHTIDFVEKTSDYLLEKLNKK